MKAAVEVFIPTSEERPRFGTGDEESFKDLFKNHFVRLGGLTRIGQIRGKEPIKERSNALSDAVHDAELPTSVAR